jgi:hypothetical protein
MNIFVVDNDPKEAARMLCDKHVVKMILESAQMLCSTFPEKHQAPYKATYINHPCTKWTRSARENFYWLVDHAHELCEEYSKRYGKRHKSEKVIDWCWLKSNYITFPSYHQTEFVTAMPDKYKVDDPVLSYRNYYNHEKSRFAKWEKGTAVPYWYENNYQPELTK